MTPMMTHLITLMLTQIHDTYDDSPHDIAEQLALDDSVTVIVKGRKGSLMKSFKNSFSIFKLLLLILQIITKSW